jgi:hypothetical protein
MFYYFDNGKKFTSKIEAIKYSQQTRLLPKFYYYDHVYEKLDWTREPSETLDYYYKQHAQRIRDNYDYVILAYSGGYDSTNILETFYYNNIKLDKIITVGALKQDSCSGVDENHNGELYHNVFPYIKELGLESITQVIDYTDLFNKVENFSISSYKENWVDEIGAWFSPHNWFWRDVGKYVIPKEWGDKKVALIFGKDKPALFYSPEGKSQIAILNHGYRLNGFQFRDTPCYNYGDTGQIEENLTRINFYWDPNNTDILLKQLHIMKTVYDINALNSYEPSMGVQTLGNIDTNHIVYNLKKPLIFKSPKSKNNIFSLRDNYLKNKKNSELYKFYIKGLNRINSEVNLNSMVAIPSRFYDMTK